MIERGTIRTDGKRWDGTTWRTVGVNHQMDSRGMVYYTGKYRSLKYYLKKWGNMGKLVMNSVKPKDIKILTTALYDQHDEGEVYIISNPAWKGWYKIGKAVLAEDRLNNYQTSSPLRDYVLCYTRHFKNRHVAERIAHNNINKVSDGRTNEWFKVDLQDAKAIIEEIVDEANT